MYIVNVTFHTNLFTFQSKTTLRVYDPKNIEYIKDCINDQLEDITTPEMKGIRCTSISHVEIISSPKKVHLDSGSI